MRRIWVWLGVCVVGVLLVVMRGAAGQATPATSKIAMKVLYASNYPKGMSTARTKEFVTFLKTHFTEVGTADVEKLTAADWKKYDVLLMDAEAGEESALDVPNITLPEDFGKPTVTIGVMGGLFTSRRGLKTGYM